MNFRFSNRNNLILEVDNHSICRIQKICNIILRKIYGDVQGKLSFNLAIRRECFYDKIYNFFNKYGKYDYTILIINLPDRTQHQKFIDELYALIVEEKLTK